MNTGINYPALAVLIGLFLLVTVMGFWASNWRRAESIWPVWTNGDSEGASSARGSPGFCSAATSTRRTRSWPCPPRCSRFGSVSGFFAVPYTIILYPIIFIYMSRLWSVSYRHGYVTAADFVRGRYGSKELSLADCDHRHPRHHAVHRSATRRHPGSSRSGRSRRLGQRHREGSAAVHRVRPARRVYLLGRPARSGGDRVREGWAHLPGDSRGDRLPAVQGRRVGAYLRRRRRRR